MSRRIEMYREEHREQIIKLILEIQIDEFSVPVTLNDQPDLLTIESFYQKGAGNFWVTLEEEQLIGTIGLIDIGNQQGVIRKMFVDKDFRGKEMGVARGLLNTLFSWAKNHGLVEILLGTTDRYHAAHRFYEKNGFREAQKLELPKNFPVMAVDSRFYRTELK